MAWVDSSTDCAPIDGNLVTDAARGSTHESYLAFSAASKAVGAWSEPASKERGGYPYRNADLIEEIIEDLAAASADHGALLAWQRRTVVARVAQNLHFFAACLGNFSSIPDLDTPGAPKSSQL